MGRKKTVAFVLSTDSILSDLNAIDQWHLWKLLNGRGSYHSSVLKEVKLPKDIISSLNWILATEPWARIPEEWWRSLWASHNGNAWVDAICSSGVGKQKDIWGRGDFLQIWYNGKDLKVIHHARDIHHTQQQPKATRCHVPPAACQASWHQHFCPSCFCMGGGKEFLCPPPPHRLLMQASLSHTPTGAWDTFIRWQEVTIRAERGCQCHQMLLKLIGWVCTSILFQRGPNNAVQVRTHSLWEAPMRAAAQRHRDEADASIHFFSFSLRGWLSSRYLEISNSDWVKMSKKNI